MKLSLKKILEQSAKSFFPVVKFKRPDPNLLVLDLSDSNQSLQSIDLKNTEAFSKWIEQHINHGKADAAIGGYGENRVIYRRSDHYAGEEPRSIHLGIDIWLPAGTQIYAPLDGIIHSFQDNQGFGNYGPTLILEHHLQQVSFYTLYGHLSRTDLRDYRIQAPVKRGQQIGTIGPFPENGDWPPHLHFQVITDLLDNQGDFPGVAKPSEKNQYLQLCPDPNLILNYRLS